MRVKSNALAIFSAATASCAAVLSPAAAWAAAQEPSISGNAWVAYAIIGALGVAVLIFVLASVGVWRRDEAARTSRKGGGEDGLPIFGGDDD